MGLLKQTRKNSFVKAVDIIAQSTDTTFLTMSSANEWGMLTIIAVGKTTSPSLRVLDRYYKEGFGLVSNVYTNVGTIINEGYVYLTVSLAAYGSSNVISVTITNNDPDPNEYTFNGLVWIHGYIQSGYFTI